MNETSLVGLFVTTVAWIPIRNPASAKRGEVRDHQIAPTDLYLPLH